MKRYFLTIFLILTTINFGVYADETIAQDISDYVSFVREGVKWVCYYENVGEYYHIDKYYNPGRNYFILEIKGDTIIDGKHYKAMHKYSGDAINPINDTIPLYLREENRIVYGIAPEGHHYPDLLVGYGFDHEFYIYEYDYFFPNIYYSVGIGEEIVLYDFNDPVEYYCNYALRKFNISYLGCNDIELGDSMAKRYRFSLGDYRRFFIIEGIGFVEEYYVVGYPLGYAFTSADHPNYHLSHVIEDGDIIYKSVNYEEPAPDDYEYVPFVREGVKWVYYYDNPFWRDVLDMDEGVHYYSFEMKGDYLIGDKHYKQVCLTHYLDENTKEVEDFIPVYLREEDKVVYAIHPDGTWYPQCPVGCFGYIHEKGEPPFITSNEEFMLYDFNNPAAFYDSFTQTVGYLKTDMINVGKHHVKRHHFLTTLTELWNCGNDFIIEGIGYDGIEGFPLFYFELTTGDSQVGYYFSHVIEDGEITYKGRFYDPKIHVGINEVMTDVKRRPMDENYYNLMGQPVGKEVPTAPGIYIHNGRKIVVR